MPVTLGQAAEVLALSVMQKNINEAREQLNNVQDQLNNRMLKGAPKNDVENVLDTSSNVRGRRARHGGIPVALSCGTGAVEDFENARTFRELPHADVDQFIADLKLSELAGMLLTLKRQYVKACEHDKPGTRAALADARRYLSDILDETNPETVTFHTVSGGTVSGPGPRDEVPVRFPTETHAAAAAFSKAFPTNSEDAALYAIKEATRREKRAAEDALIRSNLHPYPNS